MGNDRADAAVCRYSDLIKFEKYQEERDNEIYDMSKRLELADIIVKDGKQIVADLGSQCGGMTHALKEAGVKKVVSTEHLRAYCTEYLRKVNDGYAVICDSFRLPFRESRPSLCILSEPERAPLKLDALVSYMFLGQNMGQNRRPYRLGNPEGLKNIFERLSGSADTIYSVERQSEYSRWFDPNWFDPRTRTVFAPEDIEKKLKEALSPDFEVEPLGGFGLYRARPVDVEPRIGFKFTKKEKKRG